MATFVGSVTYERVPVEQMKKVLKSKGLEIELPAEWGSLWLPSFEQHGTFVPQEISLVSTGQEELTEPVCDIKQVYQFFIEKVSAIPQVRGVAVYFADGVIHVWTAIPTRDKEVQRKVYEAELQLMERFPGFSYDFTLLFCAGSELNTVFPSEAEIIYSSG